ncbi:hypothetical protein [Vibrio alginolyticus]|uniref:WYL domain-containing protein n=1 Tax=Vibrio alginolyticus TaxID=663 RepID=A0A0P0I237_VIBAL|nr:hypothetical protein [Vibrio alginolyticus]ALJ83542.1 hypothetical protein ICEValA056-2_078 [Vibrio alginolyticus]
MTQPNQTQYHLELILAIYNLIPYNKKITAKQIQAQLSPLGLQRSLRTIQRNLSAICAMFPDVMVDDRDKPFGYQKAETLALSTTAHEAVLLYWLIESTKHQLPNSLTSLLDNFLSGIAPENIKDIQSHWSSKVHVTDFPMRGEPLHLTNTLRDYLLTFTQYSYKGVFAVIGAGIPLDRSVLELILYSVSVRIGKVC